MSSSVESSPQPAVRQRMQKMAAGRDTEPEIRFRRELWRRGLRGYRVDYPLGLSGVRRSADVAWTRPRLAVLIDGCFWHRCPEHGRMPKANPSYWTEKLARNVERDRETDRLARKAGWTVFRVWEHEEPSQAARRIEEALGDL